MKATYRSKPFEAFQLAADMSNWKEALEFMGQTPSDEWTETPELIDVEAINGLVQVCPRDFICKNPEGEFEVMTEEVFNLCFEKHESHA